MDAIIRLAKPEELAAIQALNRELFEHDASFDPYLVLDWPYNDDGEFYFRGRISGDGVCYVAELGSEIVGYLAGAFCEPETYRTGRRCELENMCVKSSLRAHGVGSALFDAFKQWAIEHGAEELYVEAAFDNTGAIAFYRRNGFTSYSHDLIVDLRK